MQKEDNQSGVELVKRGIVKEKDIETALQYQREHPDKKIRRYFISIKCM